MAKDDVELEFQDDVEPEHPPDIMVDDPDLVRPDDAPDDEQEETVDSEPEKEKPVPETKDKPKPKPRKPAKDKIREQYSRIHELEDNLQEMDRRYRDLESKLQYSNIAATQHFDDSVVLRLDKAKQLKKQAYESGDVDSMLEADTELSRAVHAQQQSNLWKAENQTRQQYSEPEYSPEAVQYERQAESNAWRQQNTWFYKDSRDYDPQLASQVEEAAAKFDDYLRSRGEGELIGTRPYFQEINKYVDGLRYDDEAPQQRRSLRMKTQGHVSAPGRSSAELAPSSENLKLSKQDAQWADTIGMSHKEYAKFVNDERQAEKNRRNR